MKTAIKIGISQVADSDKIKFDRTEVYELLMGLLETEKQQIVDAYTEGSAAYHKCELANPEQYYQQTYKSE